MTRSTARMLNPITKGGHENYKRKILPVVKKELMSDDTLKRKTTTRSHGNLELTRK